VALGSLCRTFRVRRGSIEMPLDSYEVFNGTTDEDLESGALHPMYGARAATSRLRFRPAAHRRRSWAGHSTRALPRPRGFVSGDSVYVQMGDSFALAAQSEGACGESPGTIFAGNGTIHREAIVWSDEIHPDSCFGSLNTGGFWFSNTLTR
jgi:hypothetical protein